MKPKIRNFIYLIIILILLVLIRGLVLYASDNVSPRNDTNDPVTRCEEVKASWESDSDAAIFGDRVLSDFRKSEHQGFGVNAFCPHDTIAKLSALREFAASVILSGISGGATVAVPLSGRILSKVGHISVTPLIASEIELVLRSEELNNSSAYIPSTGFSEERRVPEVSSFAVLNSIPAQCNIKLKVNRVKKTFNAECNVQHCRKDLFDREFADLYRLFLYLKDSSGNGAAGSFTYHCFNPASQFFSLNTCKHQIAFNKPNQIPHTGVHL